MVHQNSAENKYIQSATLKGKFWNKLWLEHQDRMEGSILEYIMGKCLIRYGEVLRKMACPMR